MAYVVVEVLAEKYKTYAIKKKSKMENANTNSGKNNNKRDAGGKRKEEEDTNKSVCPKRKKTRVVECGESGYIKRNCPKLMENKEITE